MAARGVLVRSFNLRSRNRLRKPAQDKVTSKKKIVSTDPSTTEECSDHPSSHDMTKAVSTRRQLRPRKTVDKNANEEAFKESSKNINQQSQQRHPKGRKNTLKLKKVDKTKKKLPVYKNTNTEKSLEDQNSVYDFTFDPNDTQEKIAKKKPKKGRTNKRNAKAIQNKNKKDKKKPTNTQIPKKETLPDVTVVEQKEEKKEKLLNEEKKTKTIEKSTITPRMDIHAVEDKTSLRTPPLIEQEENCVEENGEKDSKEQIDIHTAEEKISPDTTLVEQSKTSNKGTPRIISIENADAIKVNRVSNTPTESFRSPLRPRNVFHNTAVKKQQRTSNYSFLTESLSPISNTADAVNIGSPWRPPALPTFSQAKYFIQSTPKVMQNMVKVSSKISKKPLVTQEKENKQAIKKKVLVRKNKPVSKNKAVDSKVLAEQENQENKLFVEDKEDCQVMDSEAVKEDEQLVQNKGENEKPADHENKHLTEYLNFSDTFDVLSDSEKRSTFGTEIRLFEDIEPTHFPEPPKRLYKRKRGVKFNFLEESDKEKEDKENIVEEQQTKRKKKHTKDEKRINEWIQNVNSTFKEIDSYDLLIE